jgi:antitoxin component HigA of HigAB toxin-antitoxin module
MNTALIRPIKTEADYQKALNRAGVLMSCSPDTPEADELEVLATLIELYEDKYFPIGLPDPIAAIQFRLEQLEQTESDLVSLFVASWRNRFDLGFPRTPGHNCENLVSNHRSTGYL